MYAAQIRARTLRSTQSCSQSANFNAGSLPDLAILREGTRSFDVIILTAVWMHLDATERVRAMQNLASLLRDGGLLLITLRHGPIPTDRYMFDVSPEDTIAQAQMCALTLVQRTVANSVQRANRENGVQWTHLVSQKAGIRAA
jgi:SAM-dependent methyltransferase